MLLNASIVVVFGLSVILGFAPFLSLSALTNVDAADTGTFPDVLALSANRLLAPFLFLVIGGLLLTVPTLLAGAFLGFSPLLVLFVVFLALFLGATFYHPFQRFVDRHLLGIQLPPSQLLESYAARITTCLSRADLVNLHEEEVLPSLLVRQATLLYIPESGATEVLSHVGVEVEPLRQFDRHVLPTTIERGLPDLPIDWVHLLLPLRLGVTDPEAASSSRSNGSGAANLGGRIVGCWLLGHRDPDNWYSDIELPTFKALADQTAIALTNIMQAESLRALYQSNIERREAERTRLALALHDEVLNGLAALRVYLDEEATPPTFHREYQRLTARLRQTISFLRPAMLNYGLRAGLEELVEDLQERTPSGTQLYFELEPGTARYPPRVEQHLFRVVQQALENALQHANANTIHLSGTLQPERATLVVQDNGVGIPGFDTLDLTSLLAQRHFGLAGMYERARLINPRLQIHSRPQEGTTITVTWEPGDDAYN